MDTNMENVPAGPPGSDQTAPVEAASSSSMSAQTFVPPNPALPDYTSHPLWIFEIITHNDPNFKYKYPEASPTPAGEDDYQWNKVYTAADSRMYNKNSKDAKNSRKFRLSGETRELALKMMAEKRAKAKADIEAELSGRASQSRAPPKPSAPRVSAPKVPKPTISRSESIPHDTMVGMSISEKIKSEGRHRKAPSAAPSTTPSSSRDTPPTFAHSDSPAPPVKMEKGHVKKKGTAAPVKKPSNKKPKVDNRVQGPSAGSSRDSHANETGSPDDSGSNDGGVYCICRGPDDHRMMVSCEGPCQDWYHCNCVSIKEEDARELLDHFVCPKCTIPEKLFTTWKRLCRMTKYNGCRKAARVSKEEQSKYCSDACKHAWYTVIIALARKDLEPSRGGVLNESEMGSLVAAAGGSAKRLHEFGKKPTLPVPEGADPDHAVGNDFLTAEEKVEITSIEDDKRELEKMNQIVIKKYRLLSLVLERVKVAQSKSGKQKICGFDDRLAFNDAEFERWMESDEAKDAFSKPDSTLGPRTPETAAIGAVIPYPGQVIPPTPQVADELKDMCLKKSSECRQHRGWQQMGKESYMKETQWAREDMMKLIQRQKEILEDAETREATKPYYAHNTVIRLF